MTAASRIPVLGFAAFSGTGKTTLLRRIIPALKARGLRIGIIKHSHHVIQVEAPESPAMRLRKAGAVQVLTASQRRFALIGQDRSVEEPALTRLLQRLDQDTLDLVLVEGFKHERFPKIELSRASQGNPPLHPADPDIVALATDAPPNGPAHLPILHLDDSDRVVDFIVAWMSGRAAAPAQASCTSP